MVGLCRLCASLKKSDLLINIQDESDEMCEKLQKCCGVCIEMSDTMPKSVCQLCLDQLDVCYGFYAKVQEAQEMLRTLFPSKQAERDIGHVVPLQKKTLTHELKPTTPMEIMDNKERHTTVDNIKMEQDNVEVQETLKVLYTSQQKNKRNNSDGSPNTSKQNTTAKGTKTKEPVMTQKKSLGKIKMEKEIVEQSKLQSGNRDLTITISNVISEVEDASSGDNDGYLQEVYNILGMTNVDEADQELTSEESEHMDNFVAKFSKEDHDQIITQDDGHSFLDVEEQHLIEIEDLMGEEQSKNLEAVEDIAELEEVTLDEKYNEEFIELDYGDLEVDNADNENESRDKRKEVIVHQL